MFQQATTTITSPLVLLLVGLFPSLILGQAALGGGAGGTTIDSQYPTVVAGPTKIVAGSSTSVQYGVAFTQTFKSPLGTWAFATPSAGAIGLGNIQGSVGAVKNNRK